MEKTKIYLKRIKNKGRGVFANQNIQKGEIIEICPIIHFTPKEKKHIEETILAHYVYPWVNTKDGSVVLGYGSIYNHAYDSNANWEQNYKTNCMVYKAVKLIKKGEEITVNYNGDPDDRKKIDWFEVKK